MPRLVHGGIGFLGFRPVHVSQRIDFPLLAELAVLPEQVPDALRHLLAFRVRGSHDQDGLARVHRPEIILSNEQRPDLIRSFDHPALFFELVESFHRSLIPE